jgi:hypothetical protein
MIASSSQVAQRSAGCFSDVSRLLRVLSRLLNYAQRLVLSSSLMSQCADALRARWAELAGTQQGARTANVLQQPSTAYTPIPSPLSWHISCVPYQPACLPATPCAGAPWPACRLPRPAAGMPACGVLRAGGVQGPLPLVAALLRGRQSCPGSWQRARRPSGRATVTRQRGTSLPTSLPSPALPSAAAAAAAGSSGAAAAAPALPAAGAPALGGATGWLAAGGAAAAAAPPPPPACPAAPAASSCLPNLLRGGGRAELRQRHVAGRGALPAGAPAPLLPPPPQRQPVALEPLQVAVLVRDAQQEGQQQVQRDAHWAEADLRTRQEAAGRQQGRPRCDGRATGVRRAHGGRTTGMARPLCLWLVGRVGR